MAEWRSALLDGIDVLTTSCAGRVLVFKEQAEPILTGTRECDVILAAAQYGNGRIVAVTHNQYGSGFTSETTDASISKLAANIKSWVTNGAFQSNDEIGDVDNIAAGSQEKFKILFSWQSKSEKISSADVLSFVSNGGGFFIAFNPWGWQAYSAAPGQTINDMAYGKVLREVGITYLNECIYSSNAVFSVSANKAAGAHLARFVKSVTSGTDVVDISSANPLLYAQIQQIPPVASAGEWLETLKGVFQKLSDRLQSYQYFPTEAHEITDKKQLALLRLWPTFYRLLPASATNGIKAGGIDMFPGDFSEPPETVTSETIVFTSERKSYYPTGYYAPAGTVITVNVLNPDEGLNWHVQITPDFDYLRDKDSLVRWPNMQTYLPLPTATTSIISPFGGTIYFYSPSGTSTLRVALSNVVPSPLFQLGVEGEVKKWQTVSRNLPGLWADFVGNHVMMSCPSSFIRNLDDPGPAIQFWDKLLENYHDFRGTDINTYRREWFLPDVQPSCGYMHSGYPIVTHFDVFQPSNSESQLVFNYPTLKQTGSWGLFHEFGHNMQRGSWTFDDCGEISNNIFTLYGMFTMCGIKPWDHPWLAGCVNGAVKFLGTANPWPDSAGTGLCFYGQLARDFGWDVYKKVFRQYEQMTSDQQPKSNQDEIDTWFVLFSKAAGYNIGPFADYWKIPLTSNATSQISSLPSFLSDDVITSQTPERTQQVVAKYPGILRKIG